MRKDFWPPSDPTTAAHYRYAPGKYWYTGLGVSTCAHALVWGGALLAGWMGWEIRWLPPVDQGRNATQISIESPAVAPARSDPPPAIRVEVATDSTKPPRASDTRPLAARSLALTRRTPSVEAELPSGEVEPRDETVPHDAAADPVARRVVEAPEKEPTTTPDRPPRRREVQAAESPASTASVYDPGSEQTAVPVKAFAPPQPYPAVALAAGQQGTVVLRVQLGAEGQVETTEVDTSSGFEVLDAAARDWVEQWKFAPPTAHTWRQTKRTIRVPVRFVIYD